MSQNEFVMYVGYTTICITLLIALSFAFVGLAKSINWAIWQLVRCYGRIPVFFEFRNWYHDNKKANHEP